MSSNHHCWSLGSLLLLLAGRNLGVLHQPSVSGIVGQSVLLPVSYKLADPPFPLSVVWEFKNHSVLFMSCTVMNCSLDAGKVPYNCSSYCVPFLTGCNRSQLLPENGSLLLQHLQLNDSGTYTVTFKPPHQVYIINLTVREQPSTPWQPAGPVDPDYNQYCIIGICSSISVLLLLLPFCCLWRRGAVWQQKRRIIKVQQVSGVEKAHMESSVVANMVTIYTTIGGSMEQAPPRRTPEVMYTSVSSYFRGRDPGPRHHLV